MIRYALALACAVMAAVAYYNDRTTAMFLFTIATIAFAIGGLLQEDQ